MLLDQEVAAQAGGVQRARVFAVDRLTDFHGGFLATWSKRSAEAARGRKGPAAFRDGQRSTIHRVAGTGKEGTADP